MQSSEAQVTTHPYPPEASTDSSSVYLGTSSNWSFSRRVLDGASTAARGHSLTRESLVLDGDLFEIGWNSTGDVEILDKPNLPTPSHASYLIQAVQFHVGQAYHLFDEHSFLQGLQDYYTD